jgi:predicted DNA binding protein
MTFLGSSSQVRKILKAIEELKIPYKILALTDAKFSHDSPLSDLTEKQRKVFVSAFNSGYYDIPRRISSETLAEKMDIRAPTLVMHRRKAEQRIFQKIIKG